MTKEEATAAVEQNLPKIAEMLKTLMPDFWATVVVAVPIKGGHGNQTYMQAVSNAPCPACMLRLAYEDTLVTQGHGHHTGREIKFRQD